ncbi:hypothetical protein MGWOODY_Clf475 [hydrothermal vent metagenome]|uniref:Uncharacterized protein n=1 Tax=hydrothermal vent metagenome TaxID=652676 RepID=A0A160VCB7_9ZZZZ
MSVVQCADAVGQAARDMDVGKGGPSRRPGITVGHAHRRTLLQCLDVFELRIILQNIQQRRLTGSRVAEDVFDSLGDEHLGQSVFAGHLGHVDSFLLISFQHSSVGG